MAGSVVELYEGTRVTKGEDGRLTMIRRFLVDLVLAGNITPEYAPYVAVSSDGLAGVPQLGKSAEDLRDTSQFQLPVVQGLIPIAFRLFMVGFQTYTTVSANHVIVECEYDNFTLGKFRSLSVTASKEEWPFFQRHPFTVDVSSGSRVVRYQWNLQTLNFMTSKPLLQVRMKLKVLPTVLQAKLASEAGKVHFFEENYWLFDGAHATQVGESGTRDNIAPIWDIRYMWIGDPGFGGYNQATNPTLFTPGAMFDPMLAIVPRVRGTAPGTSVANTFRPPFYTYVKIPQELPTFEGDGSNVIQTQPAIDIVQNANFNPLGWQSLPGRPLQ